MIGELWSADGEDAVDAVDGGDDSGVVSASEGAAGPLQRRTQHRPREPHSYLANLDDLLSSRRATNGSDWYVVEVGHDLDHVLDPDRALVKQRRARVSSFSHVDSLAGHGVTAA